MKLLLAFVLLFTLSPHAHGETSTSEVQDHTADVNGALTELKSSLSTGFPRKRLGRLGDQAANLTIQSHTLEEMRTETTAIAIAKMIALSFNSPDFIVNDSDKTPKMSTLLLSYLRSTVQTPLRVQLSTSRHEQ